MISNQTYSKILFFFFCFTLSSCSNKLDREKAKSLIVSKYNFNSIVTEEFPRGETLTGSRENMLNYLINQQMIKVTRLPDKKSFFFSDVCYDVKLTNEGQQYKVSETSDNSGQHYIMKVAEKRFGEITGIREISESKACVVDYTWSYSNLTPFGIALNVSRENTFAAKYYEGEIHQDKVMIVKYDDGWRIE